MKVNINFYKKMNIHFLIKLIGNDRISLRKFYRPINFYKISPNHFLSKISGLVTVLTN